VSFVHDGQPVVLPTAHVRIDDRLYLHGSTKNRMLDVLAQGGPACVGVTLLDGLVLARSQFHHSMNYRSVVIFGTAVDVTDPDDKQRVLAALCEHLAPGRTASRGLARDRSSPALASWRCPSRKPRRSAGAAPHSTARKTSRRASGRGSCPSRCARGRPCRLRS
jgi:nitroimidazol reductase NimA-like FMN-containing flavoprotein (pyridoxamine 5'-phosphate oxidase superfamily)